MPTRRVFLPATGAQVRALRSDGVLGPAPLPAHAALEPLRRAPFVDDEELEHQAWVAAADDARATASGVRRVIVSADVDPDWTAAAPAGAPATALVVRRPVPLNRVASLHIDEDPGRHDDVDLLWYDVTELDEVLALFG